MTDISVIVPSYNDEKGITILLDALNAQTIDPSRVEYIIVNNNSKDKTREVIADYAKTAKINIVSIDENEIQGSYAARNKGIRASKGEILIFTDADCVPAPDWIEKMLPGFDNPQVGAVGGAINGFPGDTLIEQFSLRRRILAQDYMMNHPYMPFCQTANLGFRKDVFRKAGLFRSGLKTAGDADMNWRMQKDTDYKLVYHPDSIILHRHRTNFADLYEQFERYGRSVVYLKQLYSWDAPREPRLIWYIRKMIVWALFKYPVLLTKYLFNKIPKIEVYEEPIRIFIKWCSYHGTNKAKKMGPLTQNLDIEYLGA